MKQYICIAVALTAAVSLAAPKPRPPKRPAPAAGGSAQVVGLQLVKPLAGEKDQQALTGRRTGTTVTVRVSRPGRHVLGVDRGSSRLEIFTDDRKTELLDEAEKMLGTWLDEDSWVDPGGTTCLFDIVSSRLPAAGAATIRLRGHVALKTGLDGAVAEQKDFPLAQDAELKAGPAAWKITGVRHDNGGVIFGLATKAGTDRIARITFHGRDGKEIPGELVEKSTIGFMGNTFYQRTYRLTSKARLNAVTVRVHHFKKVENVLAPIELTAGVGL